MISYDMYIYAIVTYECLLATCYLLLAAATIAIATGLVLAAASIHMTRCKVVDMVLA